MRRARVNANIFKRFNRMREKSKFENFKNHGKHFLSLDFLNASNAVCKYAMRLN